MRWYEFLLLVMTCGPGGLAHARPANAIPLKTAAAPPPAPAPKAACSPTVTEAALKNFTACGEKMNIQAEKSLIVDADKGLGWWVDSKDPSKAECHKIGVAKASNGGSDAAALGNEEHRDGHGQSPPGMLLTFNKTDTKGPFRNFSDFVGLKGTNSDNNLTENPRGVVLHACNGSGYTHGCICFPSDEWPKIQKMIAGQNNQSGTPVYIYAKSMGSKAGCPTAGNSDKTATAPQAGGAKRGN